MIGIGLIRLILGGKYKSGAPLKTGVLEFDTSTLVWKVVNDMAKGTAYQSVGIVQGDFWSDLTVCN